VRSARSALRCALLTTTAAGVLAVPVAATVLAQSPMEAAAAANLPGSEVAYDVNVDLAAYHSATDAAVGAQMAVATMQVAAEQAAAAQAAAAQAAEQAAVEKAAADRLAEEQAAQERASRSRRTEPAPAPSGDPRSIARALLAARGQSSQFGCLDKLWTRESDWLTTADNPTSSAYGIPQALPGSKMASAGADWRTSAQTQITWGLSYIASRYGSPCAAWSQSQSHNWY